MGTRNSIDRSHATAAFEAIFLRPGARMRSLPVPGAVAPGTEIVAALLGDGPASPYSGTVVALVAHGSRAFVLRLRGDGTGNFRPCEVSELVAKSWKGVPFVEQADTDFGLAAFADDPPEGDPGRDAMAIRAAAEAINDCIARNEKEG